MFMIHNNFITFNKGNTRTRASKLTPYPQHCYQIPEYTDIHSIRAQIGDQQRAFIVLDIYTRLVKEEKQNVTIHRITREGVHPWNQRLQGCRSGYNEKS